MHHGSGSYFAQSIVRFLLTFLLLLLGFTLKANWGKKHPQVVVCTCMLVSDLSYIYKPSSQVKLVQLAYCISLSSIACILRNSYGLKQHPCFLPVPFKMRKRNQNQSFNFLFYFHIVPLCLGNDNFSLFVQEKFLPRTDRTRVDCLFPLASC